MEPNSIFTRTNTQLYINQVGRKALLLTWAKPELLPPRIGKSYVYRYSIRRLRTFRVQWLSIFLQTRFLDCLPTGRQAAWTPRLASPGAHLPRFRASGCEWNKGRHAYWTNEMFKNCKNGFTFKSLSKSCEKGIDRFYLLRTCGERGNCRVQNNMFPR